MMDLNDRIREALRDGSLRPARPATSETVHYRIGDTARKSICGFVLARSGSGDGRVCRRCASMVAVAQASTLAERRIAALEAERDALRHGLSLIVREAEHFPSEDGIGAGVMARNLLSRVPVTPGEIVVPVTSEEAEAVVSEGELPESLAVKIEQKRDEPWIPRVDGTAGIRWRSGAE